LAAIILTDSGRRQRKGKL